MEIVRSTVLSYHDYAGIRESFYSIGESDVSKTIFLVVRTGRQNSRSAKKGQALHSCLKKKKPRHSNDHFSRANLIDHEIRTDAIILVY